MSAKEIITLSDILCEFVEVIIHNLLFIRKLYPESIFTAVKKYGVAVYKSQHPLLNEYITEILKMIHFHLKANRLRRIFICINASHTTVEKYVLDILEFKYNFQDDSIYIHLEQFLRGFCLKLHSVDLYLPSLPREATFNVHLHTTEFSVLEYNESPMFADFPCIQISADNNKLTPEVVPLHLIETGNLKIQIYIEKHIKKVDTFVQKIL